MIVDLEWRGKDARQEGADTEINRDAPEDLAVLRAAGVPRRFCRLNGPESWSDDELERCLAAGATHLFLPMVETPAEVETFLRRLDGRAEPGILVETAAGVACAAELATSGVERVYVGLNDLAISNGSASIFAAVADDTVARLRETFHEQAFGFGGVTVVDGGAPIPCRLLLAEMARLGCDFSFLRRSFKRDVRGRDLPREVARIQALWRQLDERDRRQVDADRRSLLAVLERAA